MNRRLLVGGMLLLFVVLLLIGISYQLAKQRVPGEFEFTFAYGIYGGNQLDTFSGTFTKDLVLDGKATVPLTLSDGEMRAVYKQMKAIGIEDYPDYYANAVMIPTEEFRFELVMDGRTKSIHWIGQLDDVDERHQRLRGLVDELIAMIESKDEYKALPPAAGGYE